MGCWYDYLKAGGFLDGYILLYRVLLLVPLAVAGRAFHFGKISTAAKQTEIPSIIKSVPHPQRSEITPGSVPPSIAPVEPQKLISPAAVEAPFLVPKSMALVALTSESGA